METMMGISLDHTVRFLEAWIGMGPSVHAITSHTPRMERNRMVTRLVPLLMLLPPHRRVGSSAPQSTTQASTKSQRTLDGPRRGTWGEDAQGYARFPG